MGTFCGCVLRKDDHHLRFSSFIEGWYPFLDVQNSLDICQCQSDPLPLIPPVHTRPSRVINILRKASENEGKDRTKEWDIQGKLSYCGVSRALFMLLSLFASLGMLHHNNWAKGSSFTSVPSGAEVSICVLGRWHHLNHQLVVQGESTADL